MDPDASGRRGSPEPRTKAIPRRSARGRAQARRRRSHLRAGPASAAAPHLGQAPPPAPGAAAGDTPAAAWGPCLWAGPAKGGAGLPSSKALYSRAAQSFLGAGVVGAKWLPTLCWRAGRSKLQAGVGVRGQECGRSAGEDGGQDVWTGGKSRPRQLPPA